jgi:thioredoxin-related protein
MTIKKIIFAIIILFSFSMQSQNWHTNIEDAKALAKAENKKIILVFSGSDWCAPCIKLDKNVWQSDIFKQTADEKWVLVKADFPKKKGNALSPELTENNKKLAEKYNKSGNFPFVLVLDNEGKVLAANGYKNISAEDYVAMLSKY